MGYSKTIFDVGMYDAADSVYYLAEGYRVIAIEANPTLVRMAEARLSDAVSLGQLIVVNGAIASEHGMLDLHLCGRDLGSSSLIAELIAEREPAGRVQITVFPITDLIDRYGVPYYMKVDIEGFDRHCILPLTEHTAPEFLSFEIGGDAVELAKHLYSIGYRYFKIINQCTFREFDNYHRYQYIMWDLRHRLFGWNRPLYYRRAGRRFQSGHSSGPLPEKSDGTWHSFEETLDRLKALHLKYGWWDLQARREFR
jgi:FkbM family methyltransferase